MPRRTTPFQSMIRALQSTVQPGATVTESKFLKDGITGELREVDVVVETLVGPYPLILSFECTSGARPVDVGWVEEMHGKHQTLPTDKLFLVSQHGFTAPAKAKAHSHNHVALSLAGIDKQDWAALVAKHRQVFLVELRASVLPFIGEVFRGRRLSLDARLRRAACRVDVSVRAVVDTLLAHPRVAAAALDLAAASESRGTLVQFDPVVGLEVVDLNGQATPVDRLSFAVVFKASRTEMSLTSGIIGDHAMSFGGTDTDAGKVHLTIVQAQGELPRVRVFDYGHQQEPLERELVGGVASDLQPLPDSTMRVVIHGCV